MLVFSVSIRLYSTFNQYLSMVSYSYLYSGGFEIGCAGVMFRVYPVSGLEMFDVRCSVYV